MEQLEPITRLTRDLKQASITLSTDEARFLVDSYYQMQKNRLRASNQVRALSESEEPHTVLDWLMNQSGNLEKQIARALDAYSNSSRVGRWARANGGIGPVIAAGLMAHIDITKAPTAGNIWSFAGLVSGTAWLGGAAAEKAVRAFIDPKVPGTLENIVQIAEQLECDPKWLARRVYRAANGHDIPFYDSGQELPVMEYLTLILGKTEFVKDHIIQAVSKRPWNTQLKTLCWKIGESFVKSSGYRKTLKALLLNEAIKQGLNKKATAKFVEEQLEHPDEAFAKRAWKEISDKPETFYGRMYLERKAYEQVMNEKGEYASEAARMLRVSPNHAQKAIYKEGRLPDGHIHSRAKRYAVWLFLAHYHEIAYRDYYGKAPPAPYMMAVKGHAHKIDPPNFDIE